MELEKKSILPKGSGGNGSDGDGEKGGGGAGSHSNSKGHGLSVMAASLFLVGELAGTGVMSLPHAMDGTGHIGILLIPLCCIVSCYTGHLIGQCWLIVQARCPEYRGHVRHPYPIIAYVAYGRKAKIILSCISNFSMLGSGVVFLIMSAQNVHRLLTNLTDITAPFCLVQIVVVAFVTPMTWFGTPKDFRAIALGAVLSTVIAVVLSLVVIADDDRKGVLENVKHSKPDILEFFQCASIFLFATCGHFAFPTFQNDMNEPEKLGISLIISYSALALLYLPMAVVCFVVYGNHVSPNLLLTLSPGPLTYVIIVLVTCHLVCGFVIISNPSMQHLDEIFGISKAFSWRRLVSRTSMMLFLLFICESVPKFDAIMSLVGGSANLVMMLIAPVVLYLRLCSMTGEWPKIFVPLHVKVIGVEILVVGVLIGVMSTYGSFLSLWGTSSFTVPCYVDVTAAEGG